MYNKGDFDVYTPTCFDKSIEKVISTFVEKIKGNTLVINYNKSIDVPKLLYSEMIEDDK